MYGVLHPDYLYERWHIYILQVFFNWVACSLVMFGNRLLPVMAKWSLSFIIGGWITTVLVCTIMPRPGGLAVGKFH